MNSNEISAVFCYKNVIIYCLKLIVICHFRILFSHSRLNGHKAKGNKDGHFIYALKGEKMGVGDI